MPLVRTLSVVSDSLNARIVNPRKAYPIAPGFIPLFDRTGKLTLGHALETAVLLELERRAAQVAYVRTKEGLEMDFLTHDVHGKQALIQVCSDLEDEQTRMRELRALLAAANEFPQASVHLITLAYEGLPALPSQIRLHTASHWLLHNELNQ